MKLVFAMLFWHHVATLAPPCVRSCSFYTPTMISTPDTPPHITPCFLCQDPRFIFLILRKQQRKFPCWFTSQIKMGPDLGAKNQEYNLSFLYGGQEPNYLSCHLLLTKLHISRKLKAGGGAGTQVDAGV